MLTTSDHANVRGILWTAKRNPAPRVVVVASHPRSDFSFHHAFPDLLDAGYGCLGANTRTLNNDMDCVHEKLVLDIAAWIRWLRQSKNVEQIVLLGNSGGGSLFSFYQAQSKTPPLERISTTPGGQPTGLADEELVPGDGLIFMAAHTGQGLIVAQTIDPAAIDEHNPMLTDASVDMYNPANGFRPPPEWVQFDAGFVSRYRAAQLERVRRLDNIAYGMIADSECAGTMRRAHSFESLGDEARRQLEVREAFEPIMIVYRTMANLHYVDRHLDPSNRGYGCLFGNRPDIINYKQRGFARVVTPHAWLSTWSGRSSNASTPVTAPRVTEPAVVINAGRDRDVYPRTHALVTFNALSSVDKEHWDYPDAQHYFEPEDQDDGNRTLASVMARLVQWMEPRYPL